MRGWEGAARLGRAWQGRDAVSGSSERQRRPSPLRPEPGAQDRVSSVASERASAPPDEPGCPGMQPPWLGAQTYASSFPEPCGVSRKQGHWERPWAWWARLLAVSIPQRRPHPFSFPLPQCSSKSASSSAPKPSVAPQGLEPAS